MKNIIDFGFIVKVLPSIAAALPVTLQILIESLFFGFILAFLLTLAKLCRFRILRGISTTFISFIRGTPTLLQLFLIYFGLPQILNAVGIDTNDWSKMFFAILAFTLNTSAYLAEVMRSAYLAVDYGQHEAGYSIGMTRVMLLRRIVLPQALVIALPNFGNTIILFLKDIALAFSIGIVDIMGKAKIVSARDYGVHQLEIYLAVAAFYWIICFVIEKGLYFTERLFSKNKLASSR